MKHDGDLDVKGAVRVGAGQIGGGAYTLSRYEPNQLISTAIGAQSFNMGTSGVVTLVPFTLPCYVAAAQLGLVMSCSVIVPGTSQQTQQFKPMVGIYTQGTGTNYSLLSMLTSASWSMEFRISGTSSYNITQATSTHPGVYSYGATSSAGSLISSAYSGPKIVYFPVNSILSPGNYWLGMMATALTTGFSSGFRMSYVGNLPGGELNVSPLGSFSVSLSTGTRGSDMIQQLRLGMGQYGAAGNVALPNAITISSMSVGGSGSVVPHMVLWSTTPF